MARWLAGQNAKAKLIEANAEADSLRIIAQAQDDAKRILNRREASMPSESVREQTAQRLDYQERKRQSNLVSVVGQAAEELGEEEVPDQEPDHDWIARYFEYVKDVSEKDVQQLWAKVLAGSVRSPASVSLRTLTMLRDMSSVEAKTFKEAMRYRIQDFIFWKYCVESSSVLKSDDFQFRFVDLGWSYSTISERPPRTLRLNRDGNGAYLIADHVILLSGRPNTRMDGSGDKAVLKPAAMELADLCDGEVDWGYLKRIARVLHDSPAKCTMQAARLVGASSEPFTYDQRTLALVDPA